MNLFNFSPPTEDEFSLTYLLRIAQMNGISNLNHFFNNVVFDTPCSICSTKDISYSGSYTGMEFPVNKLIQCLPTGDVAQLDSSRFLMEHTLFPLFSPFFGSDSQKEEFIHKYCSYSGYISAMEFIKCNRKCLYLCPSCMLDDKNKYGFPYVHRIHQAPGVYVCPIHHKPLVLSSFGKSMDPFEQLIEKNDVFDPVSKAKYLVAHKSITVDLNKPINWVNLAKELEL